jgi:hypothetical protein
MALNRRNLPQKEFTGRNTTACTVSLPAPRGGGHCGIYSCPFVRGKGFFCGYCREPLGVRPEVGGRCTCGARIEEVMYPGKS